MARDIDINRFHPATNRLGRIVCATSDHADGSPRVIVEWQDGTESKVVESELRLAVASGCSGATGIGGGLHLHFPENEALADPGLAALHRDQLQASAVMEALKRAADGCVRLTLDRGRLMLVWRDKADALFVFEAITGRKP